MQKWLEISLIDGTVLCSEHLDFETIELRDENDDYMKYVRFWFKHSPYLIEFNDVVSVIIEESNYD